MKHLLLYLLLLSLPLSLGAQAQEDTLREALRNCNYTQAVRILDAQWLESQNNVPELLRIADDYRTCNQTVRARRCYEQALTLEPENRQVKRQLIRMEMLLGNYDKSISLCHEILAKDTLDAISFRLLGNAYYSKRELDNAYLAYLKSYGLDAEDFNTVEAFSTLLNDLKDYEGSLQMTELYREKDTTNVRINQNNAEAYFRLENYDEAIRRYHALELQGDHSFYTLYFKGVSHFAKQQYFPAHFYLEQVRPMDPENITLLYYLAIADAKTSWKQDGQDYIDKVEELVIPTDSMRNWVYNGVQIVYPKTSGRYIQALEKMYEMNPKRYALLNLMAQAYEAQKNTEKATEYYRRYVNAVPEADRTRYGTALQYRQALEFLEKGRREQTEEDFWKDRSKTVIVWEKKNKD